MPAPRSSSCPGAPPGGWKGASAPASRSGTVGKCWPCSAAWLVWSGRCAAAGATRSRERCEAPRTMLTALLLAFHACPPDLTQWKALLGAEWIDCHQITDLTTTNNPYTDPNSLTGMGFPPPGSGTLNSKYSNPTSPPVSGLQIDGYFADDCNAFQAEPALTAKDGSVFIPGCTPPPVPGQTCVSGCHHDAQFVLRIPDSWDGHLLTAGTPGIRDAFSSDFILSDYAMEKGWAYASQAKGNMGANFFRAGTDEMATSGTPWIPGAAVHEWTMRMRQATAAARALLRSLGPQYGHAGVTFSYAAGISNGGYQTRRAIETDFNHQRLYDRGMDWEGTPFFPALPPGIQTQTPTPRAH